MSKLNTVVHFCKSLIEIAGNQLHVNKIIRQFSLNAVARWHGACDPEVVSARRHWAVQCSCTSTL